MLPSNPICPVCNYATSAVYCDLPSPEQLVNGVKPLDSLPAAWWNNMWNMVNCSVNQARGAVGSFITELNNVLAGAGICPNCVCTDQLYQAIDLIRQTIGNATTAGAVKSSSTPGMVSIDANGFMTANCLGNASQLTTTAHTLVGAVNELKSTYDSCTSGLTTAVNGKAPISHASSAATYGVGTATDYGHLRISDTYTSDIGDTGMAASQSALAAVYNYATQISAAAIGLGNTAGCALGTASAGSATTSARSDHVHPLQTYVPITGFGNSSFTFHQTYESFAGSPSSWAHYLISNHGDGSNYYNFIIREPFTGVPEYSRMINGVQSGWYDFITSENIGSQSVNCGSCAGNADYATSAGYSRAISRTVAADTDVSLIFTSMADAGFFRLRAGASSGGWTALETAGKGTEEISVAQYTGEFAAEIKRAFLLDRNGNTSFPGTVSAALFSGNINGWSYGASVIGNGGPINAPTGRDTIPNFLSSAYANGYPTNYGSVLNLNTNFPAQIFVSWPNSLYYRSMRDTSSGWESWVQVIDSSNIGSQSVNYAASAGSAGSAGSADVANKAYNIPVCSSGQHVDWASIWICR